VSETGFDTDAIAADDGPRVVVLAVP
jgi:hypothetical protein